MKNVPFNLDALNISELLSTDELLSINGGTTAATASLDMPPGIGAPPVTPGYTEATIIWSQIP